MVAVRPTVKGVDWRGFCGQEVCPCEADPGEPCPALQADEGRDWCYRCGWHRRHHPQDPPPENFLG